MVSTRSTPAPASMLATTLAVIATRAERGAAILARIAEIRDGGGDAAGRGALQRIHHHHHFHQGVIGRLAGRLQHEHVLAAHVFEDFDHHLAIGKARHRRTPKADIEMPHHIVG